MVAKAVPVAARVAAWAAAAALLDRWEPLEICEPLRLRLHHFNSSLRLCRLRQPLQGKIRPLLPSSVIGLCRATIADWVPVRLGLPREMVSPCLLLVQLSLNGGVAQMSDLHPPIKNTPRVTV